MRNMLCATALLSLALLGAGCKKSPSLVGKWNGTTNGQTATFEFKPDNSMTVSSKQGPAELTFVGDYKLEGEKMTMTLKDVQAKGIPEAYQSMLKKMVSGALNKPQNAKVTFTTEDEVALSTEKPAGATAKPGGAAPTMDSMTLTRVKEGS